MEACGRSNYWARTFQGYGHMVKLISSQYVKPYILDDQVFKFAKSAAF